MDKVIVLLLAFALVFVDVQSAAQCPADDGSGNAVYLPHETECGKFYECQSGEPIEFDCPPGLYFDASLDVCNWDVDCGNLRTSTAAPSTSFPNTAPTAPPTEPPETTPPSPEPAGI